MAHFKGETSDCIPLPAGMDDNEKQDLSMKLRPELERLGARLVLIGDPNNAIVVEFSPFAKFEENLSALTAVYDVLDARQQ